MVSRRAELGEWIVREFGMDMYTWVLNHSAMFNSLWPHGLYSARFFRAWDCPGKNTGVGCHSLLQGIFPTQESNPGLPHCRWILYHLSHQGSPRILEWVAIPFSRGSSRPRIEPRVPTLQMDSLPIAPPRKPKNTGVGSLFLLQGIYLTQESNQDLLHCKWILYQLSYHGSLLFHYLFSILIGYILGVEWRVIW